MPGDRSAPSTGSAPAVRSRCRYVAPACAGLTVIAVATLVYGLYRISGDCWSPDFPSQAFFLATFSVSSAASLAVVSLGSVVGLKGGARRRPPPRWTCSPWESAAVTVGFVVSALALLAAAVPLLGVATDWPLCVD